MTKGLALFLFILSVVLWGYLGNHRLFDFVFICVGILSYWINRNHVNILGLLYIVIGIRLLEVATYEFMRSEWGLALGLNIRNAFHLYPIQFCLDLLALTLIRKRWLIYLKLNRPEDAKDIVFTNADYYLSDVYKAYLLLIAILFFEKCYRSLDMVSAFFNDIGLLNDELSESLAGFANPEADFFYDIARAVKYTLNCIEYVIILAMASEYFRSAKVMHA